MFVAWRQAALQIAQEIEKKSTMELRSFKRAIKEAQEQHDDLLLQYGVNSIQSKIDVTATAPDSQPASPLFTALEPFDEELEEVPSYRKSKKKYLKELKKSLLFENLRHDDHQDGRYMDKSFYRMRTTFFQA